MTPERKQELEERAFNYLHQHNKTKKGLPINCDLKCLVEFAEQVEREVWEQSAKFIETTAFLRGNDQWRERKVLNEVADWCREQGGG